jgi:hypothetical protein
MLVSLNDPINSFRELDEDNICVPRFNSTQIMKIVCDLYPSIQWSEKCEGVYFGITGCNDSLSFEVWIIEKPFFSLKVSASEDIVKNIAKSLHMTAIDVQRGDLIYSQ